MFGKQLVSKVMNRRLPAFPKPACAACSQKLPEPRPFHTEQQGAPGVLTVHCLAACTHCGAKHKGTRNVGIGKVTRALDQEFHVYNDDDAALVRSLLPKYQQNPEKLANIEAMPVND